MKKKKMQEIFNKDLQEIKNSQSAMRNTEEAEFEQLYEDLQDLLELTPPKDKLAPQKGHFHYRGLECKSKKSRNTWSNKQIWPWNTE